MCEDDDRGEEWFKALSQDEKYDLEYDVGDQFVSGNFVWRDWGFRSKPSAAFLKGAERARNHWLGAAYARLEGV